MGDTADRVSAIDQEIRRVYAHAQDKDTGELARILDLAQIDSLLERRFRITSRRGAGGVTAVRPDS